IPFASAVSVLTEREPPPVATANLTTLPRAGPPWRFVTWARSESATGVNADRLRRDAKRGGGDRNDAGVARQQATVGVEYGDRLGAAPPGEGHCNNFALGIFGRGGQCFVAAPLDREAGRVDADGGDGGRVDGTGARIAAATRD